MADPIIVGPTGYFDLEDLHQPLVWTSTQHLRTASFMSAGAIFEATTSNPHTLIAETFADDTWIYTVDLSALDGNPCVRYQLDLEPWPGACEVGEGKCVLVRDRRGCEPGPIDTPYTPHPGPEPSPVPEPASIALLGVGLFIVAAKLRRA